MVLSEPSKTMPREDVLFLDFLTCFSEPFAATTIQKSPVSERSVLRAAYSVYFGK